MTVTARIVLILLLSSTYEASFDINNSNNLTQESSEKFRLPNSIVPIHYDIALTIDINNYILFKGILNVKFEIKKPISEIVLHTGEIINDEDYTNITSSNGNVLIPSVHFDKNETDFLILKFLTDINPGIYTLNLKYFGYINEFPQTGLYKVNYTNVDGQQLWLAKTKSLPAAARKIFPCWDEPGLKATFNISVKHHTNFTVLTNMPVYNMSAVNENGFRWSMFEKTPPMSTSMINIFIIQGFIKNSTSDGSITVWSETNNSKPINVYLIYAEKYREEMMQYMNSTAANIFKTDHFLSSRFNNNTIFQSAKMKFPFNEMTYENEEHNINRIMNIVHSAAIQVIHQWFRNTVTPKWWDDWWLSDGLSMYFQNYIIDKVESDWRSQDHFVTTVQLHKLLEVDLSNNSKPIRSNITKARDLGINMNKITTWKGATMVRMMSHILTEEVFHEGIRNYVKQNEFGSATSAKLFTALQDAFDKSNVPYNKFNLSKMMLPWLKQVDLPLISVYHDYITGEIRVSQWKIKDGRLIFSFSDASSKLWIPLSFATASNPDFSKTFPSHWLKPTDKHLTISGVDKNDWVIFNLQQAGYYFVNYDTLTWEKIAKYLNSDKFKNIHPLNRAAIISSAHFFNKIELIDPFIYKQIINYLSREEDPIPWLAAFNSVYDLTVLSASEIINSSQEMLKRMAKVIEKIGYDEHPNDKKFDKLFRMKLRLIACTLGDITCQLTANYYLKKVINDGEYKKLPEDFKDWVSCWGLSEYDNLQPINHGLLFPTCYMRKMMDEKYGHLSE